MNNSRRLFLLIGLAPLTAMGCCYRLGYVSPPPTLGAEIDETFRQQEHNAEAAKYVIYAHEFELNRDYTQEENRGYTSNRGWKLNSAGEDHLKRIAANLNKGHDDGFPVVIQRSETSVKPGTKHEYPVHYNDELDARRRAVVVASLERMGVADAEDRVVVAYSTAEGLTAAEGARVYQNSLVPRGSYGGGGGISGGYGGFGSGFGGGGFF